VKTGVCRFWVSVAGLPPESVALILVVGLVLGVFPVFGCPTVLCLLAAFALRLNWPALQLVNQVSSPVQLALLVPFARVGARVVGDTSVWNIGGAARNAVVGWFCLCVPAGLVFYIAVLLVLRRFSRECFNGLESPG
jgi:uncharacterized protein (DUF2062 family)